ESVLAGLLALKEEKPDRIMIHDGARPFISNGLISRIVDALEDNRAVLPVCPVTDTLRRGANNMAGDLVNREDLFATQTPQGFHFDHILDAHQRAAKQSGTLFTDDGEIARSTGLEVALVDGEMRNVKITHAEDFEMAELRLRATQRQIRTGQGFDVHAFGPGDSVNLCGIKIPYDAGLKGHSDADVGLHALTDAILGAISAGDIGAHFPPNEQKWKAVDSAIFLQHAAKLVADDGGRIGHVDVTIICEAPKIGPYRDNMRKRIAEILKLELNQVSVKATTTEKLGFAGRKEGIAAQAIATVYLP
ncbi:MAG: 2-C-methyl-D-erythritol 2,4-cyclodiphosphate synthase, partial [Fimbriimonadaceae bacterium]|nr:2-C-methyl-D-erythritol 2,4-cyclodiphosphate synthase [Alphaproteobacteria bacterium]